MMKSFFILFLFPSGCSNERHDEERYIVVEKYTNAEYMAFKKITEQEQVDKTQQLLNNANWKKKMVDMARQADFRFTFQYKAPEVVAKAIGYEIWSMSD